MVRVVNNGLEEACTCPLKLTIFTAKQKNRSIVEMSRDLPQLITHRGDDRRSTLPDTTGGLENVVRGATPPSRTTPRDWFLVSERADLAIAPYQSLFRRHCVLDISSFRSMNDDAGLTNQPSLGGETPFNGGLCRYSERNKISN